MSSDPSRESEVILYQTEDGQTRVEVHFEGESAWLSLNQMAELFQSHKSFISRHIANIFHEGEPSLQASVAKYATTAAHKPVELQHL
jgi:hypothetical protein